MPKTETAENNDSGFNEEQQYADELAAEQEFYIARSEAAELYNQGQEYGRPSLFKYSLLALLALIVDAIDLIDLTGIGIIIGRIISFVASVIIIIIFWLTDTKQKRADEYVDGIQKRIEAITAAMANAEINILRTARLSRKIPGAKQLYRKLHLKTVRPLRLAAKKIAKNRKNPIVRFVAAGVLNLVPFLAVLPWMLIGIWLSYRAEKESYKNAREAAESVLEATGET